MSETTASLRRNINKSQYRLNDFNALKTFIIITDEGDDLLDFAQCQETDKNSEVHLPFCDITKGEF